MIIVLTNCPNKPNFIGNTRFSWEWQRLERVKGIEPSS
jgi:hypothetical protein